jgi:transcription initiation factor TFIIIB Brf1 subunit/transcription initiation factor TFIIB
MSENTPHSVAAGIIYLVIQTFDLCISKKDIHKVSGISEVTINKCYKKLHEKRKDLIPGAILAKYNISI